MITILDCYTDEPAGLGVPPYLGVYPRYLAGSLDSECNYLTIDDFRMLVNGRTGDKRKTDIKTYNLTRDVDETKRILSLTTELIVIAGVHTPGKYLSAIPGTLKEIVGLVKGINCKKILTGPAVFGSSVEGGKFFEKVDLSCFEIKEFNFTYDEIAKFSVKGTSIIKQIPDLRIIEIETARGCSRKSHCSFCMEPIKNDFSFRDKKDIVAEVKAFYDLGCLYFRLGKQSDYYSHPDAVAILEGIRKLCPKIKVLHIDNVNPVSVVNDKDNKITKAIVKYCSEGNTAAFGVESFDEKVIKSNNLNSNSKITHEAVEILNKFGKARGENGMPQFLPGINLLFGLIDESKETGEINFEELKKILDSEMLLRRINIRQVDIFEGTYLFKKVGNKFLRKNKKYYWKWRNSIRQEIDNKMLEKLVPIGTILKDVRMEIYDGNTTFGRQIGTYPLIVGVKEKLELKKFYNIRVIDYMLRSVVGEVVNS